ncbi:antibiotic biosynthesis monooxygenase [Nocardioides alkalitolerans]|uniref:antibiotic biosynthesis monooxygenase n=1 Tax=Nocardioides alkalitolerans TaxID=281714 RepID=UPI000694D04E|nr:antibiotic biosynthesis monooxygenase [Nocardioides alkalitolerans]
MSDTAGPAADAPAPSEPVTVAITRHADLVHTAEMMAWIRAGTTLAEHFPGFLGHGFVRSGPDDDAWHMLYRFADAEALAGWEASSERRWWLGAAQGLVGDVRVLRMTGIEGWFDPPASHDVEHLGLVLPTTPPPRWKQAVTIFLVFLPLSLLLGGLAATFLTDLWWPLRTLATTMVATPLMVFLGLPWITRKMDWWLHGRPAPWRRLG